MDRLLLTTNTTYIPTGFGPAESARQSGVGGLTFPLTHTIVYSFWLMLATCSFWFVRLEDLLALFQIMYQAGSWPISIYPLWLRVILTFLVPIVFAVTVPAAALVGRLTWLPLLGTVALALGLLVGSHWFWQFGLRHYTGASA